jgi:hypothetical protein
MSTDNLPAGPAEPTDPVAPTVSDTTKGTPVKPDNWYNDAIEEVPVEDLLATPTKKKPTSPGQVSPDNWYNDSAPKG